MTGPDSSLGGTELWLTAPDQLVEIGRMWLRPNAVWAIRSLPVDSDSDGPSCAVTGPGGAEYRLPGLTAEAAARLLNGDDALGPT